MPGSLKERRWTLATAESCTGGRVARAHHRLSLRRVPGRRGQLLDGGESRRAGGSPAPVDQYGAVSEEDRPAMAEGPGASPERTWPCPSPAWQVRTPMSGGHPVGIVYIG